MDQNPLQKARELILQFSTAADVAPQLAHLSQLPPDKLNEKLVTMYNQAPTIAAQGDVKGISTLLRIFDHFGDNSHDRMLLHYIAQAEANRALRHQAGMEEAMKVIAEAFADADAINEQIGTK